MDVFLLSVDNIRSCDTHQTEGEFLLHDIVHIVAVGHFVKLVPNLFAHTFPVNDTALRPFQNVRQNNAIREIAIQITNLQVWRQLGVEPWQVCVVIRIVVGPKRLVLVLLVVGQFRQAIVDIKHARRQQLLQLRVHTHQIFSLEIVLNVELVGHTIEQLVRCALVHDTIVQCRRLRRKLTINLTQRVVEIHRHIAHLRVHGSSERQVHPTLQNLTRRHIVTHLLGIVVEFVGGQQSNNLRVLLNIDIVFQTLFGQSIEHRNQHWRMMLGIAPRVRLVRWQLQRHRFTR
mmetsp:Transcript_20431/g.32708  ORF Transcript_20431/g.32708 Transcript_20431/m.32708 type:complete len:288 (-) Transcript_20431:130-993(-)